jgi:plasmid maintenance system killer protein
LRDFKKSEGRIQEEAKGKILLFSPKENHEKLRVHKLKGRLKNCHSFSVTYSHRIVFHWEDKKTAVFLAVGDHSVYE